MEKQNNDNTKNAKETKDKGKDSLDSSLNTEFHKTDKMASQTNNEDPDTDPNTVTNKPGFKKTDH